MKNLGDYLRTAARTVDELFIEGTGRELAYYRRIKGSTRAADPLYLDNTPGSWTTEPVVLRGFYETPEASSVVQFGIDSPDEMDVELGYETTLKKVGLPAVGDLIVTNLSEKWTVVTRRRKDDMVRGQNRLVLTVQRFQESATTS